MRLAKLLPALVAETQFLIIGNQKNLKLEMFVEEIDQKCM
jgi:hypothetical protein